MANQQEGRPAPTSREMRVIEYLAALDIQLSFRREDIAERLAMVAQGPADWDQAREAVARLLPGLYDTLPIKALRHLENMSRHGEMLIRLKPVASEPGYALLSLDDLSVVMGAALAHECGMCFKDGQEVKRCALRRALINIYPPDERERGLCAYRMMTASSSPGDSL